ncbi:ribonucleoside-triphosphate reductase [candidate division WOR-1 bacterium DG_54_3]|uniref:Ribonucleoside-triphosphate reductase n=1 Tax=candidate division WOR-1 bacterium DG_54_3 TaxID=1703775 RepID=A0A0S7Y422_UNCSA|nr:MAG: ribonucleoside-triphosphate reductase [candidate division WOR-1 bacterium DG_54_3]
MDAQTIMQKTKKPADATDLALFVRTSAEDIVGWDREKIVAALIRETNIDREMAEVIGQEVEEQIKGLHLRTVTAPLIRELVDVKLLEHGLEEARRRHTRLGSPLFDVKEIIFNQNKENANVPHGPEATNLTLSEGIKKEFALLYVFTQDIADAHMRGDIHLHDLGFVDRPYCSGQSVEYVKKFGLDLPNALSIARPARHPDVLLAQMVKFSAALQGVFAGAIGWDAVNIFFAPFLVGLSDKDVHQIAQMMVYEYSQQAVARGGQAIFSDINLYWEVPKHFENVPAIGPGGEYTGKNYADYIGESQRFAWALFDVYREGDGSGRPFFFPKPLVHMTEKFFQTPGHEEFLMHIAEVSTEMGNTYYVFDRGETAKISECCRLSFKLEKSDLDDAREPWRMRYSALQNVTINLPRLAYKAGGLDEKLFELLNQYLELSAEAHIQKKKFIEELLGEGSRGPLSMLTMQRDGQPYLRMWRVTYLMGILGLNEMIQAHLGKELHESQAALKFGLKAISHMKLKCEELSKRYNMHFVLEQTPAESTAYRFAKLDMEHYSSSAERVVRGSHQSGEIYYTNSTYFDVSHPMNPIDKVKLEGLFHPLIDAGALTHVWLGESKPSPASVANFVIKTFQSTQNAQIAFSPEFTTCSDCGKTSRGLRDSCPYCQSENVEGITRITGYFSKVSGWNKGKLAELKDRHRNLDFSHGS